MTQPDRALLLLTARHLRNALNFLCRHELTEDDRQELRNNQHQLTDALAHLEDEAPHSSLGKEEPMTQPEQEKSCPFKVAALIANPNPRAEYNLNCEPKYCALGIEEENRCALKDIATLRDFDSRLSAILAHLAGYTPPEPNLHSPGQPTSHEPDPSGDITPLKNGTGAAPL